MTPSPGSSRSGDRTRWRWFLVAAAVWVGPLIAVGVRIAQEPMHRTVTMVYRHAVENWLSHQTMYEGEIGLYYLPTFIPVYLPFHVLGGGDETAGTAVVLGEIFWRVVGVAALAAAVWLIVLQTAPKATARAFAGVSLAGMWMTLGAVSNGQANVHFAAATALGAWAMMDRRWKLAAGCMALALAIKPLGLVMIGLAAAGQPRMRLPLAAATAVVLAAPFACGPPAYVWSQYVDALTRLTVRSTTTVDRFADIAGLLRGLGAAPDARVMLLVRAGMGVVFLAVWLWVSRRRAVEPLASIVLLTLGTGYLMLFNPMTEHNSYVILAPAMMAYTSWLVDRRGAWRLGKVVMAAMVLVGLGPEFVRPVYDRAHLTAPPLIAAAFIAVVIVRLAMGRRDGEDAHIERAEGDRPQLDETRR